MIKNIVLFHIKYAVNSQLVVAKIREKKLVKTGLGAVIVKNSTVLHSLK